MNSPELQKLLETAWRRELSREEQARLAPLLDCHPEARADWQTEAALTRLLARAPDAPVPSNFTARVLQAVAVSKPDRQTIFERLQAQWRGLLGPRLAWATVLLVAAVIAVTGQRHLSRTRLVRDLAQIPAVSAVPAPEILEDFDVIQQLSHVPVAANGGQGFSDEELLAALQ